jgi:hypothetical protein
MNFVPLVVLLLLSLAVGIFAPVFGVVIFVLGFFVFLAVIGLRPRADERKQTPERDPVGVVTPHKASERAGVWGEKSVDDSE